MKKLIPLTFALILACSAAMAGGIPLPTCSCELCALDGEQTCEDYWTGINYICQGWHALNC